MTRAALVVRGARVTRGRRRAGVAAALAGLLVAPAWPGPGHPPDVIRYIERREICEHFRTEPWPEGATPADDERRRHIAGQRERWCKGADRSLATLKRKYADRPAVLGRLMQYEDDIEAGR